MSTGRICPCSTDKDKWEKIVQQSVWHNPGMYSEESLLYTERKVGAALNVLYSWRRMYFVFYCCDCLVAALGLPGWMGLDKSAAIAIVLGCILLTTALATAYKLYHCRRNRDLRNDEMRTANTGQYHGRCIHYPKVHISNVFSPQLGHPT